MHCGLRAEACLFYTETGDPKYTPIHKLEPLKRFWHQEYTLLGKVMSMLGVGHAITDKELEEWSELVYDSCTLCGRCSMVCPVGNDVAYMVRKIREGMAVAGHAPEGLHGAVTRSVTLGSPMGVNWRRYRHRSGVRRPKPDSTSRWMWRGRTTWCCSPRWRPSTFPST